MMSYFCSLRYFLLSSLNSRVYETHQNQIQNDLCCPSFSSEDHWVKRYKEVHFIHATHVVIIDFDSFWTINLLDKNLYVMISRHIFLEETYDEGQT